MVFAAFNILTFCVCILGGATGFAGLEEDRCDQLVVEARLADLATAAEDPPRLAGKWVSEGCEVRSGPEFLLRSYTFLRNHTFRLLQFHYEDESCTLPLYTVSASGRLRVRGRAWLTPGATQAEYSLHRVTVTSHSAAVADELAGRVNASCPGYVRRRWRPYREYVVLSVPLVDERNNIPPPANKYQRRNAASFNALGRRNLRLLATDDVDCLSALHAAFHELQLVRVQRRPPGPPDARHSRHELLLGDVHSRPELRATYRPSAFQTPLLRADQVHGCHVCNTVSLASELSPPHLNAKAPLPAYLGGEWVSPRCETRPLGLFLTRRLQFFSGDQRWNGEYRFFADPACSNATFIASASGRYSSSSGFGPRMGRTEFDFHLERAALTLLNRGLATSLQGDSRCLASGLWRVGVPRDLAPAHGCAPFGIAVPSVEYDLVRVEVDESGNPLLFMGQPDTDNRHRGPRDRPTAYQPPLVQCRTQSLFVDNGLYPEPFASSEEESGAPSVRAGVSWLLALLVVRGLA